MEKNWKKRWMAGAMAFALCCTTLLQTGASAVSAAEVGGVSAQSETQIEVQTETQTETQTEKSEEELIEETVADPELALMVTEGEAFDIQNDFTGLKLSEGDHVELKKAAMEDGTVFDYNHAGTYKCVYLVTPASGEAYLVARNITVTPREAETDGSNGGQEQESGDDEPEADPVLPTISPEDAPETLEEPEETEEPEEEEAEEFSDEEPEDGSHQVDIVQGNEFNIELDHEDGRYQTGETVSFSGDIPQGSLIAVGTSLVEANQTENTEDLLYAEVSYDEGTNSFSFEMPEDDVALSVLYDQAEGGISTVAASDGDLWDDSTDIEANTYYYYSDGKLHPFDSVMGQGGNDSYKYIRYKAGGKTYTVYAYCMQHSKQSPPSGTTYKNMVELDEGGDDRYLRKAMFYGYGGPGWGGTFNGYNIKSIMEKYGCSSETRAMQHYLVDYLYDGESGFGGSLSTTAKNMLKEIKAALSKMPDPTTMELTPGLSASANGNQSPTFTWKANAAFVITIHLENGVSLVNETTGKTGTGNVSVKGGEKFHLEATTQNIGSLKGKYAITSNYPLNFHAMLLKLANSQDIGFGYYTDTLELNLEVDWPDEATVKIIKKDKGSNALLAGAVYGIYADEACTKLIKKMPATNAKGESEVKITKTQDTVYLREISGPSGYVLDTKAYGVKLVVGQTASKNLTDKEQKGALTIYKEGEVLTGAAVTENGVTFAYEKRKLKGAVYSVYAGADIKAADGTLIYKKGALVKDNLVTGDDGSVTLKDLYLGTYTVTETKAPDNYVCKGESKNVELVYAGQTVEVQTGSATFLNERQKVELSVEKQDAETGKALKGATFGLYNKEAISSGDKVIVKADTLLQEITSNEKGKAAFTLDLPLGRYYVKELQVPAGYVSSDEILEFDATYQGQNVKTIKLKSVKKNQPTTVEVTKADITTGTELDGASMSVLDKDGNVIDSWTSVKDSPHVIKRLQVGKTYILREELAPYGYLRATDVEFTISDTAEVQKVKMEDEVPVARLLVNKKGEFLDSVSLLDNAKGMIEHLFNYVTGNLTDVTFNVYAAEAIRAADGVSADYYAADELVGSITTDGNGIAQMDNLPLGRYYIVEKETSHGYVLDNEPRYVDLTYRDQDTPLVTYSADWQNARQRVQVEVLKKEKDSDKVLSGAIFGLYAADDIVSSKGKVLLAKDTLIELKTTDEDGKIQFVADLPVDSRYYIKELAAPDGYVTDQEPQEFTFEYQGSGTSVAEYAFTFEDEQTTVELSKADLTDKKELPGASLKVTDEDGNTVDEWVSKEEAHIIKGLIVGKKYKMTETKPADGYVTAESIEFTVENTKEVQKHQMFDDVTKMEISKKDITDSSEVPGAKLIILDKDGKKVEGWTSKDKPHMVEKLPVGEYTLREEQAPDGYLIAEDVKFTVKDTGKVQKVKMKDAHPYGKLVIKKTDSTSKAALSGAEFELREKESGKVVEKLVTDKTGTATSGKIPIATYKNGKIEKTVEYILVETKAPNGYELSSKKEEIRFEYKDGKTKVIEIVKEIKNTKSPSGSTPTGNSPKTGDSTNIWLPILLAVLSACGIGGVIWYKKKKGN